MSDNICDPVSFLVEEDGRMRSYATEQRSLLSDYLSSRPDVYLTAMEVANALEPKGVSRSSVYRNLLALEGQGQIVRSAGPKGETLYRFCGERCSDHIHLQCERCGRLVHLDEEETRAVAAIVSTRDGFELDATRTVIYGICEDCR
jgi:Fur family ferric uptake transcriptional regulator